MHKKGNISLLVLFVLVACSLLGIIAVQYTRHMAIQTSQIYNYYKAYYLAKGGSEIGLSLMQLRGPGYSQEIEPTDTFVQQNISSGNSFSLKIQGDNSFLSLGYPSTGNCDQPMIISGGDLFILPLFTDTPIDSIGNHFSSNHFIINKSDLLKSIKSTNLDTPRNIAVGIITSSGDAGIYFTSGLFEGDNFFEKLSTKIQESFNQTNNGILMNRQKESGLQNYLIIANKDSQEISFCLDLPSDTTLPLPKTYISSFGYAGSKKIGIETIYQQPIPSYLIDSSLSEIGE